MSPLWPVAAIVLLACRPAGSPGPTPVEGAGVVVDTPVWLRADGDVAAAYSARGKIVRAASVRLEHDGQPIGLATNRSVDLSVIVLDEDDDADAQRPRVLCVHAAHRIAVHYDVDDLGFVTRDGAVLGATPVMRTTWADDEPGVRVAAGTVVRTEGSRDAAFVPVVLERPALRARGFVASEHVGLTYQEAALARPDAVLDAKIVREVAVLASPGGPEIARVRPQMVAGGIGARRLGRTTDGHVLVAMPSETTRVVGWVEAAAIEGGSSPIVGTRITPAALVEVDGALAPSIELAAGTLLHGGALRDRVGVVTQAAKFHCIDACDTDEPVVQVGACTAAVPVVARAGT